MVIQGSVDCLVRARPALHTRRAALIASCGHAHPQGVVVPATVVVGVAATVECSACSLHVLVGRGSGGWLASMPLNHSGTGWREHTFATDLQAEVCTNAVV
eukprot:SAG11_NODE_3320_length_2525_cov_2.455070_4_plen_101_part_00